LFEQSESLKKKLENEKEYIRLEVIKNLFLNFPKCALCFELLLNVEGSDGI
jgi:hypothetical protein